MVAVVGDLGDGHLNRGEGRGGAALDLDVAGHPR